MISLIFLLVMNASVEFWALCMFLWISFLSRNWVCCMVNFIRSRYEKKFWLARPCAKWKIEVLTIIVLLTSKKVVVVGLCSSSCGFLFIGLVYWWVVLW